MGKQVADAVLDGALNIIKNNVTEMRVCSGAGAPVDRAAAVTATLAVKSSLTSADFTIADGTSGRKVTSGAYTPVDVDTAGTATHIALCSGSTLYYVTTCTSVVLADTDTITIPAWSIQIDDPSA